MFRNPDSMKKRSPQGWNGWFCLELHENSERNLDDSLGIPVEDLCLEEELGSGQMCSLTEARCLKAKEGLSLMEINAQSNGINSLEKRKLYFIIILFYMKDQRIYRLTQKPLHGIKITLDSYKLLGLSLGRLGYLEGLIKPLRNFILAEFHG